MPEKDPADILTDYLTNIGNDISSFIGSSLDLSNIKVESVKIAVNMRSTNNENKNQLHKITISVSNNL